MTGAETVPGPSRDQYHITASVLWGLTLAETVGQADPKLVANVAKEAARMYAARSKKTGRGWEFLNTMSPDENHTGDNDLYTNVLLQWIANGRTFTKAETAYYLPKDNKSFLTYDGDAERGYKQAAAVLSIYPLQFPAAEEQAKVMIDRFASKVIKNGPAMSDSVHATIYARLGESEKAYSTWKECWEPFTKGAQMVFSEKRVRPRTYFYTGAAGALNTVLYGFAGLRFDESLQPGDTPVKLPVKRGVLSYRAHLPAEWKSVTLRGLNVAGQSLDLRVESEP
jgi:trehalose/maltose hydrolase-like predicted phosphorylase